jgi:predicted dehydrogenase
MSQPVRIGLIGCGAISGKYLQTSQNFPILQIASCADINPQAAADKAKEFNIPKVQSVEELLNDDSIDVVLNLTVPKAHAPVSLQALQHGKHVYLEKPLAVTRDDGKAIMAEARKRKLSVGCAPDTFLGSGLQTARKAIDDGLIGRPVAFTAFMMCPGHEHWHPSPEFYYEVGGGPMLDMGPYYVTALMNLLGPVKRLSGLANIAIGRRTITSKPKFGKEMIVETPDNIVGSMEFEQGAIGTLFTSFATRFPQYSGDNPITIFGEEGTLLVSNPNHFDGAIKLRRKDDPDFIELPPVFSHPYERAVGLADMAHAIRGRRPIRASGQQALAVLDVMLGFLDSSDSGKAYRPKIKYKRPAPMPTDLPFGILD